MSLYVAAAFLTAILLWKYWYWVGRVLQTMGRTTYTVLLILSCIDLWWLVESVLPVIENIGEKWSCAHYDVRVTLVPLSMPETSPIFHSRGWTTNMTPYDRPFGCLHVMCHMTLTRCIHCVLYFNQAVHRKPRLICQMGLLSWARKIDLIGGCQHFADLHILQGTREISQTLQKWQVSNLNPPNTPEQEIITVSGNCTLF